jgi:hypothetical protein
MLAARMTGTRRAQRFDRLDPERNAAISEWRE